MARVLESMAVLEVRREAPERALTLCSAAARLRHRIGVHAPIIGQDELSLCLEEARQAVDPRGAEQAHRRGYGMSVEEAIRFAESSAP